MIILFAAAAAEAFIELPDSTKRRAAKSLELLKSHPNVYPVRQRGLMRGYGISSLASICSITSSVYKKYAFPAISPGVMRQA